MTCVLKSYSSPNRGSGVVSGNGHGHGHGSPSTSPSPRLECAMRELSKTIMCGICLDDIEQPISLVCSHTFCKRCLTEVSERENCLLLSFSLCLIFFLFSC